MEQIYIYATVGFITGFVAAWIIRTVTVLKIRKSHRDVSSFFETEKLRKELLQKENLELHKINDSLKSDFAAKESKLITDNKRLVEDVLLLQKNNEDTEALLKAGEPELYNLKIKVIEANNELARYKSQTLTK